jgi:uncharacterized protein YjbI with pentapeptide repeats
MDVWDFANRIKTGEWDYQGVDQREAWLFSAGFHKADTGGEDLTGANLTDADLSDCILEGRYCL